MDASQQGAFVVLCFWLLIIVAAVFVRQRLRDRYGPHYESTLTHRVCADCGGQPSDFAIVDEAGTFSGWLCEDCDRRERRRWRRGSRWRALLHRRL
jgi:hypothetical protein